MVEPIKRALAQGTLSALLLVELAFSVLFVSSCELPNWIVGPRQASACSDRWVTVMALLFPSGINHGLQGRNSEIAAPRKRDAHGRFISETDEE